MYSTQAYDHIYLFITQGNQIYFVILHLILTTQIIDALLKAHSIFDKNSIIIIIILCTKYLEITKNKFPGIGINI